jgi:hypothetical protein
VPSVGVPVEHFEPPGEEPVNAAPPPPAAPQQPSREAPGSAEEGAATQVAG